MVPSIRILHWVFITTFCLVFSISNAFAAEISGRLTNEVGQPLVGENAVLFQKHGYDACQTPDEPP